MMEPLESLQCFLQACGTFNLLKEETRERSKSGGSNPPAQNPVMKNKEKKKKTVFKTAKKSAAKSHALKENSNQHKEVWQTNATEQSSVTKGALRKSATSTKR